MAAADRKSVDNTREQCIVDLVGRHPHPVLRSFYDDLRQWGDEWRPIDASWLPAAERLPGLCRSAEPASANLPQLFTRHARDIYWEQSYRSEDGLVGDDMLAGYGFSEVVGRRGPFVSTRVRCGIGVWGPDVVYPLHRHAAEEIYLVMSGDADFIVAGETAARAARDVVHVPSMTPHGFTTRDKPLAVFYLWRAGDLRQTSRFD